MTQDTIRELIEAAITVSKRAYAPYSDYQVGAALLSEDGAIFTGCNVENASYPASICAERTALVKAVSEGQRRFVAIVVVTRNGGFPCGICRQMLYEFSPDMRVIVANMDGEIMNDTCLNRLLVDGFGPASLEA